MEEQQLNDDSHYEISLTATQAFVAFVLLLLSLAAAFAFGVMVGRGQLASEASKRGGETETTQITERPMPAPPAESVQAEPVAETAAPDAATDAGTETATEAGDEIEISSAAATVPAAAPATPPPAKPVPPTEPVAATGTAPAPATSAPVFAQLLATSDAKRAEALAAKLIDAGFTAAFVDRVKTDKGTIHRVRVRFRSDADARAAVPALQKYTTENVLVTTK